MENLVWGLIDGIVAPFVAALNAGWGTEFGFYDMERGGGIWYRFGFLYGAASVLGGAFSARRRRP